ncbi:MAG: dihydrofolate reductase [Thermoleophilia bacterium]|nr:dihydrofolate reductase [Thermoleophilia bacterium]
MRKVIGATFVTMDGVMQAPGGPEEDTSGGFRYGGWTVPYFDDMSGGAIDAVMREPFDLLLGRRTYDIFAAYWPFVDDSDIAERFNACIKYVATSSSEALTWKRTVRLQGNVVDAIRQLKESDGPNLLVQGSSVLYQTLLHEDLLDELTLLVFPIVLGTGKRLFGTGAVPAAFETVETRTSPNGVVISKYLRAGQVQTGSFAAEEPSRVELERRERMNLSR